MAATSGLGRRAALLPDATVAAVLGQSRPQAMEERRERAMQRVG